MLKLLPQAVLRLIFNQCSLMSTYLFAPLEHAWSQLQNSDNCERARTFPYIASGVAGFSGSYPRTVIRLGHIPTSPSASEPHSGASKMMWPGRTARARLYPRPGTVHHSELCQLAASSYAACSALTGQPTMSVDGVDLLRNDVGPYEE